MAEMREEWQVDDVSSNDVETRYVAFCDILGFGSRVLKNFDETLNIYRQFGELLSKAHVFTSDVSLTMYSDSMLVTGTDLAPVLKAVQNLSFLALANNFLIRGGIANGRYWERRQGNDLLVVSDALVRAVKLEASVSVPAVVLADDIEIPDDYWLFQFSDINAIIHTPLLHFRDRNIVNPFNMFWLHSAGTRAQMLMHESPDNREKYLWFLSLHAAVTERQKLVPEAVVNRFLRDKIIRYIPPEEATTHTDD